MQGCFSLHSHCCLFSTLPISSFLLLCYLGVVVSTDTTSKICPYHKFCPGGVAAPVSCPEGMLSKLGSTNITDCTFSRRGWSLNAVTIIFNGTNQSPEFKHPNSKTLFRQLFQFKAAKNSANSITFNGKVTNVEVLAVGGGGAGGIPLIPWESNNYLPWAGGGGGSGTFLFTTDFKPDVSTIYNISVGKGGKGVTFNSQQAIWGTDGANGENTEITCNNIQIMKATGGGGGGQYLGGKGGSGGGSLSDWKGAKDTEAVCPGDRSPQTSIYLAISGTKYACEGAPGYSMSRYVFSGGGGGALSGGGTFIQAGVTGVCAARGGNGINSNITGKPLLLAAGGGGLSVGRPCNDASGGIAWNETSPVVIGGSTPGGDGYPDSGSGGASAGSGLKSGSGANGILIIAWDPEVLPCPVNYYNDVEEFSPCAQCQQGWFALSEGSSTCTQCGQGMYPNFTAGFCQSCKNTCNPSNATSVHCTGNGTTVCCERDSYFIDGVSAKCMPCDQGSYSLDGSGSSCILCPVNSKKSNSTAETVCECDLTQGDYMHNVTLNTCIPCPENYYCTAQQTAIKCPAGTNRPLGQLPINICNNCTNHPLSGEYVWVDTGVCEFQCKAGYYLDILGEDRFCNPCTQNFTCALGQTAPNCNPTCSLGWYVPLCAQGSSSDNQCQQCPPLPPTAVRTSQCDFTCPKESFYNTATKLCNKCSKPVCSPGQYATNCSKEANSVCVACTNGPWNGPFAWNFNQTCVFQCSGAGYYNLTNNRTCQDCDTGTYRSSPTSCSKCNVTQCTAGTNRTQCGKGETADSVCAQCSNTPTDGLYTWITACNFTCANAYYLSGTACAPCSNPSCIPSKYPTTCTRLANSVCAVCTNQPTSGSITYNSGCNFTCNGNTYFNSASNSCGECPRYYYRSTPTICSKCTVGQCAAGLNRTQCGVGSIADAACVPCSNNPGYGEYDWTAGCAFTCKYGLYYNSTLNACLYCPMPQCPYTGQYPSPCTDSGYSECIDCVGPHAGQYDWISGCNFTCSGASYYKPSDNTCNPCSPGTYASSHTQCTQCNTSKCHPGMYKEPCSAKADAQCSACTNGPGSDFQWTEECAFKCNPGFYYNFSTNKCLMCNQPACPPGQTAGQCTAQNTTSPCEACSNRPTAGPFVWTSECTFNCTNGTYSSGGKCLPCNSGTYLSSPTGCAPCNASLCPPGLYRTQCPSGSVNDSVCSKCKTQVTGPFAWTSQCALICVNQTYLLNGTNCTPCTDPCPNGTYASSQCTFAEDTQCTPCAVIPQPPNTFSWTGACNFQCVSGFVWNKSHCLDEAVTDMVIIQSSTDIEFNNTVEEVCANLDLLVYAVTSSMEEVHGTPFTGNVTSVNNDTVDVACRRNTTAATKRLLAALNNNNTARRSTTGAIVNAESSKPVPKSNTTTNPTETNQKIERRLTRDGGTLSPSMVDSKAVMTDILRLASGTVNVPIPIMIAAIVVVLLIICCVLANKNKQNHKQTETTKHTASQYTPPKMPQYTLLPRIRPP